MKWSDNSLGRIFVRVGLGLFFLVFGLLKLVNTDFFVNEPYKMFYGFAIPGAIVMVVGVVQLAMALSFFWGKYSKYAGWIASVMLLATIIATLPKLMATFVLPPPAGPPGFLFVSAIPLFFMALSEAFKEEEK